MRIAICLSGQPRHLKISIPSIVKNLIECNENVDVFFHTWWDNSLIGTHFDSAQPHQIGSVGSYEPDSLELLGQLKPKRYTVEAPKKFPESFKLYGAPTANQESMCSVFYSQWSSGELKKSYESDHGFVYDTVIRTRLDMYVAEPIDLKQFESLKNDNLILASKWQDIRQVNIPGLGDYTMDDNFAISSSSNIDKFLDVYPNMLELNSVINPPFAENYLGWNCRKKHKLKVITRDFNIEIVQRMK